MRAIGRIGERVGEPGEVIGEVVDRAPAIGNMQRIAFARVRNARIHLEVPARVARQRIGGVHAAPLQRDPVRAHVAFLEHVRTDPLARRERDRRTMHGELVAEQHEVGDAVLVAPGLEVRRQPGEVAAVVPGRLVAPVKRVAGAEIDPAHPLAMRNHRVGEAREERRRHALQEKEVAAHATKASATIAAPMSAGRM
jgi:hypothetical protein